MLNKFNSLEGLRYAVTELHNVVSLRDFARPSLVTFKVTMSATYEQLIAAHLARLKNNSNPDAFNQVSKNHMTAIRAFMRHHQKSLTTSVGPELSEEFENALKAYLATSNLSERTRADRRSLLNAWRTTFAEQGLISETLSRVKARRTLTETGQTPFETTLRAAIKQAKTTAKTAAKQAGISTSAVQRWMNGAIPNMRTVTTLEKMDVALGLKIGTLGKALAATAGTSDIQSAYRARLSTLHRDHYQLKLHELTSEFVQEWRHFFDYKTSAHPGALERNTAGQWALTDVKLSAAKPNVINSCGSLVSASANAVWCRLSSFFGFLRLPSDRGGYALDTEVAQALAWLANSHALDSYFKFLTRRSGGIIHTGHRVFASFVISLTHPQTGYLTQRPELFHRLPIEVLAEKTPAAMCSYAYKMASAWKMKSTGKSRNPLDAIRNIVELDEPLLPIIRAMEKLRRIGNSAPSGSKTELLARRDELILGLLIACPIRAKNMQTLTYLNNNSGAIYKTGAGQWRIRIELANLKNGESRRGQGAYDIPVAEWLHSRLDEYVAIIRPKLLNGTDPGYLLLTDNGKRLNSYQKLVTKLTRHYIAGCAGFGPHAFRHIVATAWLKKNPNDFLTVSELLGDTVETVIKEYAHLKQDVAFSRHETHVSKLI